MRRWIFFFIIFTVELTEETFLSSCGDSRSPVWLSLKFIFKNLLACLYFCQICSSQWSEMTGRRKRRKRRSKWKQRPTSCQQTQSRWLNEFAGPIRTHSLPCVSWENTPRLDTPQIRLHTLNTGLILHLLYSVWFSQCTERQLRAPRLPGCQSVGQVQWAVHQMHH